MTRLIGVPQQAVHLLASDYRRALKDDVVRETLSAPFFSRILSDQIHRKLNPDREPYSTGLRKMIHKCGLERFCILVPFFLCFFVVSGSDVRSLKVGEEIKGETVPLNSGRRIYDLLGLKKSVSYEVKISYPATIPARFSIQLKRSVLELLPIKNRRLLNTEKLIFRADSDESVFVILTAEAEGVVAKKNVSERKLVIYNIVCDELMLGIPHAALWVGVAAIFCLLVGTVVPYFLTLDRLLKIEGLELENVAVVKIS